MSTRSMIGIKNGHKVTSIYCHYDGYVSNNGVLLMQFYETTEQVEELISMGDMSSLAPYIEDCVFYHKHMGEDFHLSEMSYEEYSQNIQEEFDYLFDPETEVWMVKSHDDGTFQNIEDVI